MSRRKRAVVTTFERPKQYWSAKKAAEFLGYDTVHGFRQAVPKLGIPVQRLGRQLRFLQEDLEAVLSRVEVYEPQRRKA
jgi:hypothetical protein